MSSELAQLKDELRQARAAYVASLADRALDDGQKAVCYNRFQAARLRYLDRRELELHGTHP